MKSSFCDYKGPAFQRRCFSLTIKVGNRKPDFHESYVHLRNFVLYMLLYHLYAFVKSIEHHLVTSTLIMLECCCSLGRTQIVLNLKMLILAQLFNMDYHLQLLCWLMIQYKRYLQFQQSQSPFSCCCFDFSSKCKFVLYVFLTKKQAVILNGPVVCFKFIVFLCQSSQI